MAYRFAGLFFASVAAFATVYVHAYAADVPIRKPGLWQLTTVSETTGMATVQACIAATDDIVTGENTKNCSSPDAKKIADETFINVTCRAGNGIQKISTLLTGDFSSWYRAVTKITFDPPQDSISHLGVIVDAKYLSPTCTTVSSQVTEPRK